MNLRFYKPNKLAIIARCNRDSKIRENALKKYSKLYGDLAEGKEAIGDIACFSNYKDTRDKAVDMLISEQTLFGLSVLREAEIDTNFKDTKELIIKKLVKIDTTRFLRRASNPGVILAHLENRIKKGGINPLNPSNEIEANLIKNCQILKEIKEKKVQIPLQLTGARRKEIEEQIETLNKILETNQDALYSTELNITKARLIRHDRDGIENVGFGTHYEQMLVCMVRSVDINTRIRIFDSFVNDINLRQSVASYGFKHCRIDDKRLAGHILDYVKNVDCMPAVEDAAKYSKIKEIRNKALKYIIQSEENRKSIYRMLTRDIEFESLASIASEGNFVTSFDAFAACIILTMKERDEHIYKRKIDIINSIIKRPNPFLKDWFFSWMNRIWHKGIDEYVDRTFDYSKSPKIVHIQKGLGKKLYVLVDSIIGTYYFAKLLKWYVIGSAWLHPPYFKTLPKFPDFRTNMKIAVSKELV